MSQENVELVRRVFAELAADLPVNDVDLHLSDAVLAEFLHPSVEYVPVAQSLLAVDSYTASTASVDSGGNSFRPGTRLW